MSDNLSKAQVTLASTETRLNDTDKELNNTKQALEPLTTESKKEFAALNASKTQELDKSQAEIKNILEQLLETKAQIEQAQKQNSDLMEKHRLKEMEFTTNVETLNSQLQDAQLLIAKLQVKKPARDSETMTLQAKKDSQSTMTTIPSGKQDAESSTKPTVTAEKSVSTVSLTRSGSHLSVWQSLFYSD
jgi:small-conductance mechanosensitive channel